MTIKAHGHHILAVEVAIELPETCPHCHVLFGHGEENLVIWTLDPTGCAADVIDGKVCEPSYVYDGDGANGDFVVAYSCRECEEFLYRKHQRTWVLEAMDHELASQLKTLLYDNNVLDENIRKKVFGDV